MSKARTARRWSVAEEEFLVEAVNKGLGYKQIAKQMGRTAKSVQLRKIHMIERGDDRLPARKVQARTKRRNPAPVSKPKVNAGEMVVVDVKRSEPEYLPTSGADVTQLMIAVAAGAASAIAAMIALGLFL